MQRNEAIQGVAARHTKHEFLQVAVNTTPAPPLKLISLATPLPPKAIRNCRERLFSLPLPPMLSPLARGASFFRDARRFTLTSPFIRGGDVVYI